MPVLGASLGLSKIRPAAPGLLDFYSGAAAAYSLRALRRGWIGGDVVEVRRDVDGGGDTHKSFTEGAINSGAMLAWVTEHSGTANGFVSIWYDQSGSANNATQIATNSQPKIVDAGALVVGGLDFDGVDDELKFTGAALAIFKNVGYGQVFSVATSDETGLATGRIFELSSGAASARYLISESNATAGSYRVGGRRLDADSFDSTTSSAGHGTTEKLVTGFLNWADAEAYLYQNGANVGTDLSFQTTGNTEDTSSTGANNGIGTIRFDGRIREVLIYNTNQMANRVGIETNINDHYSIY